MSERCFDVIAENPKEQHVAKNVCDTGMQEQAGQQRQKRRLKAPVARQQSGNARGHHGVHCDKHLERVRRKRNLMKEYRDVSQNQRHIHEREFTGRIFVAQWNEHGSPSIPCCPFPRPLGHAPQLATKRSSCTDWGGASFRCATLQSSTPHLRGTEGEGSFSCWC